MKKIFWLNKLYSLNNTSSKGVSKWWVAAIVLSFISNKMHGDLFNGPMIFPFFITAGIYVSFSSLMLNLPQFTKDLPFTSREQIHHALMIFAANFIFLMFLWLLYLIIFFGFSFHDFKLSDFPKTREIYNFLVNAVFYILYYFLMTVTMLPLALVRKTRNWYMVFAGISILITGITLGIVNLVPDNKTFVFYNKVFGEVTAIPGYGFLLIGMGILGVAGSLISYQILQKMNAPKRFEFENLI